MLKLTSASRINTLRGDVRSLSGKFSHLKIKFTTLQSDVESVRHIKGVVHANVGLLTTKMKKVEGKMKQFDSEVARLEDLKHSVDNVILYNVSEEGGDSLEHCKTKVISFFNENFNVKTWRDTDVIREHRLRIRKDGAIKPRPIIAKLRSSGYKMDILKSRSSLGMVYTAFPVIILLDNANNSTT